jgi:hypothetical protein
LFSNGNHDSHLKAAELTKLQGGAPMASKNQPIAVNDWQKLLDSLADGYKDHPLNVGIAMRVNAAIIATYIKDLEKIIEEEITKQNSSSSQTAQQQINKSITQTEIVTRLYTIRNIANVAFQCPDKYVEVYILRDIINHISEMAQSLIDDASV